MLITERVVKVRDGKIVLDIARKDGDEVMVIVETVPRHRSLRANRYYFGALVRALSEYTGMTTDEVHELIKFKFNPKEITDPTTGVIMVVGGTTTALNSVQFAELTMRVQDLCHELGITNVSPEKYWQSIEGQ